MILSAKTWDFPAMLKHRRGQKIPRALPPCRPPGSSVSSCEGDVGAQGEFPPRQNRDRLTYRTALVTWVEWLRDMFGTRFRDDDGSFKGDYKSNNYGWMVGEYISN